MPAKRPVSKRKQNGKKAVKSQVSKSKQKFETESTPKEQISELEKEILTIKINESESKLSRKKHLCSYMEEEISIYKTLYNEKQLLKSESMKLLNKAFEDFATEIFLLDQELDAMRHTFNEISQERKFCHSYRKKVEKLSVLEAKLEENLLESEKCFDELPELSETFAQLEEKAAKEKEKFMCGKEQILQEFESCLLRMQTELNLTIDKAITDTDLKLDNLPFSYKNLFMSGWMSSSWLELASQFYDSLQRQNIEIERRYNDLLMSSIANKEHMRKFFSKEEIVLLFQLKREIEASISEAAPPSLTKMKTEDFDAIAAQNKNLVYLKNMTLQQQNKIKGMKSEIEELERAIRSLEVPGETYIEKSYLVQIVFKAGNILKQEL